jgi:hypothetical protein
MQPVAKDKPGGKSKRNLASNEGVAGLAPRVDMRLIRAIAGEPG